MIISLYAYFLIHVSFSLVLVPVVTAVGVRAARPTKALAIVLAVAHPVVTLGLAYSLALRMHQALGGWPESIGFDGLPDEVALHGQIAQTVYGLLFLGCYAVWPIAALVCACVRKWRAGLFYLGLYALAGIAVVWLIELAPEPFLNWWRD